MHAKCNAFVTLTLQTHKSNVCYVCAPQWLSRHATNSEHHYSVYVILRFLHIFMHLNISDDLFSYAVRIQLAPVKFCYGNALHGKRALTDTIHIHIHYSIDNTHKILHSVASLFYYCYFFLVCNELRRNASHSNNNNNNDDCNCDGIVI